MQDIEEIIRGAPNNPEIIDAWRTTAEKLEQFEKVICSISGGSDSDIVLDLCASLDKDRKITYVFFDTGLEYQATKDHIKTLEAKYGIRIVTAEAKKTIPVCCEEYGAPFISKMVSDYIYRLQKHHFTWEDRPFEVLYAEYPNCLAALKWWCNEWGENSQFNIGRNSWLKEFMIANPPGFKISDKCCHYTKKTVARTFIEKGGFDLNITGVRKAEGGIRATAYKGCFTPATERSIAQYRPVFLFKQDTKRLYEGHYGIKHSACYEAWGFKRTGCAGCPLAKYFNSELEAAEKYEPELHKALHKAFDASYDYTRKYRAFQAKMNCAHKTVQAELCAAQACTSTPPAKEGK